MTTKGVPLIWNTRNKEKTDKKAAQEPNEMRNKIQSCEENVIMICLRFCGGENQWLYRSNEMVDR